MWMGKEVAFKCFKVQDLVNGDDTSRFSDFERELSIMSSVSHPNILRFYGCSIKAPRLGILMEFCSNGDLKNFIMRKKNEGNSYPMKEKLRIFLEVCSALQYLHANQIIHRDLKPENILITSNFESKVMDFGLSKVVKDMNTTKTVKVGTSKYMAPEVTLGEKYNSKVDVFSMSIIIWEVVLDNFLPFGQMSTEYNLENKIANQGARPEISDSSFNIDGIDGTWLVKLVETCWNSESEKRPTFKEIHKIISEKIELYQK